MTTDRATAARTALAALGGLLAAFAALAFAELAAAALRPGAGPLTAVGGSAIDRTPAPVKDWAIRTFGEDDKLVLRLGIVAVLALFAVALGVLALRRPRTAVAGVLVFGIVGAAAAVSRPDATGAADALPSLAGALAGAGVLYVLAGRLTAHRTAAPAGPADGDVPGGDAPRTGATHDVPGTGAAPAVPAADAAAPAPAVPAADPAPDPAVPAADPAPAPGPIGWDRRGFLVAAGAVAAASAGAGALGRVVSSARGQDAVASRSAVVLPRPASPAAPVPAGAALRIRDLTPFVTPNKDFYRVDTALVVPKVDATRWRLRIHGRGVRAPLTLTYRDLLDSELIERDITLTCVSNEVGGPYAGNARWIGVRLAELLERAGVRPPSRGGPADQLVARSVDGMTLGTPVEDVMDGRDALLAVGMNGEPLPFDHGFPVRMVVPGLYGYVSACKWIEDLELTTFDAYDPYWVKRKWARRAPVKTQSRIDTPKPFARPAAGTVMVAGVAWAQHRGIRKVEVRVDDGPWQPADLAAEHTADTWRQWSYPWRAVPGTHTLTVRATDGTGETQTATRTRTVPDGAGGRHSVVVTVD